MSEPDAPIESEDDGTPHVPAGTWASESTEAEASASDGRPGHRDGRSSGTLAVRDMLRDATPRSATPSASTPQSASSSPREAMPARPPFLASELLRQRDERREPIAVAEGRVLAALGGSAIVVATGTAVGLGSAPSAGLVTLGVLGIALGVAAAVPVPAVKRALALAALGGVLVAVGLSMRGAPASALATLSALCSAAGLVLRSKRVGSWPARGLVATGAALGAAWLGLQGVDGATIQSFDLAGLVRPLVVLGLVAHLALTLLAFVDDRGSSGSGVIGALGLVWAIAEASSATPLTWPVSLEHVATLAPALALPATAIALAQVFGGPGAQPAPKLAAAPAEAS